MTRVATDGAPRSTSARLSSIVKKTHTHTQTQLGPHLLRYIPFIGGVFAGCTPCRVRVPQNFNFYNERLQGPKIGLLQSLHVLYSTRYVKHD